MIKKNFNLIIIIFIFFTVLIGSFSKYSGVNHIFYLDKINYLLSNELNYQNDFYFSSKSFELSSIYFFIIKYFQINLFNDFLGFGIYILFGFLGFYWIYLLIKNNLDFNFNVILLISFFLLWNNSLLLSGIQSAIFSSRFDSPSFFANCFLFLLLINIIKEKWFYSMLIISLLIFINIKTIFLPSIICVFFFLIKNKDYKKFLYISFPIISVLIFFFLNQSTFNYSYNEKLFLFEEAIKRDQEEASFLYYSIVNLIFYYSSFFFIYFTIYNKQNNFFLFSKITILITLIFSILVHLYFYKFYIFYPNINIVSINPVRNIGLYNIFFNILLIIFIIRLNIFANIKISLIFIYFILLFSNFSNLAIYISVLIILLNFLYLFFILIFKNYTNLLNHIINNNYQTICSLIIICCTLVWSLKIINDRFKEFDSFLFKNEKKWTTIGNLSLENEIFKNDLYKLRNCDNFILHYAWADTDMYSFFNYLSNKSRYISDASHLRNNLKLMREYKKRVTINQNIFKKTFKGQFLTYEDIKHFRNLNNVVILIDNNILKYFLNNNTIKNENLLRKYKNFTKLKIFSFTINNEEFFLKSTKNYQYSYLIYKKDIIKYPMIKCINKNILN